MESASLRFQWLDRHACTTIWFGTTKRFFPRSAPSNAEKLPQQKVFGVHRHVGFELALPPTGVVLQFAESRHGAIEASPYRLGAIDHLESVLVCEGHYCSRLTMKSPSAISSSRTTNRYAP